MYGQLVFIVKFDVNMADKIQLTESDLHRIVRQVINEIGYRGATLTVGANMKANAELANGRMHKNQNQEITCKK